MVPLSHSCQWKWLHLKLTLSLAEVKDLVLYMMHLGGDSDNTDCPSRMNAVKNYFRMPVMKQEAKFQAIALYNQV